MLLATLENMEKCNGIPGVVALDTLTGDAFSANAGDYFNAMSSYCATNESGFNCILAVKVCKWVDPLTGEDIIAQIPAEDN